MRDSLSVLRNKRIMLSSLSIIHAVVLVTSDDVFVPIVVVVVVVFVVLFVAVSMFSENFRL